MKQVLLHFELTNMTGFGPIAWDHDHENLKIHTSMREDADHHPTHACVEPFRIKRDPTIPKTPT